MGANHRMTLAGRGHRFVEVLAGPPVAYHTPVNATRPRK